MFNRKPMSRRPFRSPHHRSRLVLERLETRCLLSGGLDPTFGVGGLATVDFTGDDRAAAVALQPDGRIVLAGTSRGENFPNFGVARLLPNGSPDPSFGNGGETEGNFGGTDVVTAVALQPDGKIVVVGFTDNTNDGTNDYAVLRLNTDGSQDLTFDDDGKVFVDFLGDDRANAVAIQPDGRIVLVGSSSFFDGTIVAARLNTDGSLDNTFGSGGKAFFNFDIGTSETQSANAVALQSDGRIVIAGTANGAFVVVRITSNGIFDNTFGSFPPAFIDFGGFDTATGIAVQLDGKIVVSGRTEVVEAEFAVARLLSDGSLDTTFNDVSTPNLKNGDGKLSFKMGLFAKSTGVAIQPGGKIVMAGFAFADPAPFDFALARINPNGTLDASFDGDGKAFVDFGSDDEGRAIALQPDGKILVAGFTKVGSSNSFAVARVLGANIQFLAIGGAPGLVEIFSQAGTSLGKFFPYQSSGYVDAVAVALGDVNSDGIDDLITAATIGNPNVMVYNGAALESGKLFFDPELHVLANGFPYAVNFNVGASVAAGDVNGDGFADIITGAVPGNPHVKVFDGRKVLKSGVIPTDDSDELLAQGFAYGINFNVGANVAAGDVNGDGYEDIVTGASAGNPHTKVFDAQTVLATGVLPTDSTSALLAEFFPFALQFNVGVFVAAGDYDRDGFADIITGASVGNPEVRVYNGGNVARGSFDNSDPDASLLDFFFAFEVSQNIGVSVGAADFTGDGRVDALTGTRNGAPRHRVFQNNAPDPATILPAFDVADLNFEGAIYVAA